LIVGRPPDGKIAKHESETALRAHVAASLEQRTGTDYLHELGLDLSRPAVYRAVRGRVWRPAGYMPPGPTAAEGAPAQFGEPLFRDWILASEPDLGLGVGMVVISPTDEDEDRRGRQRELYRRLRRRAGVRSVALTVTPPTLYAFVLTDGEDDRRAMRAFLEELDCEWEWQEVDMETSEPAIKTWRELTRRAAEADDLVLRPADEKPTPRTRDAGRSEASASPRRQ
jgi:hypothetical protein